MLTGILIGAVVGVTVGVIVMALVNAGARADECAECQERQAGEWERDMWFRTCSVCGATTAETDDEGDYIPDNYCPNCGACMKEDT